MYVWVDALTNYLTVTGFPDEADPRRRVLADGPARDRQGHRPVPRGLLAGLPDVGRAAPAQARLRPRLPALQGREDVEVARQRPRPVRARRHLRGRPVRYFVLREVPFGGDGSYSHEAIIGRINADLANDLGNLAQRSLSMVAKNCDGAVPDPGRLAEADRALLAQADALPATGPGPDGRPRAARHPGRDLGRGGRGQPLLRRPGAVEAPQVRPGADERRALHDPGGAARRSAS